MRITKIELEHMLDLDRDDEPAAEPAAEPVPVEPTPVESRAAFYALPKAHRTVLCRLACEALGRRSVTPEEAGCYYLARRAAAQAA